MYKEVRKRGGILQTVSKNDFNHYKLNFVRVQSRNYLE